MPVFNDSENKVLFAPEGDYAFCVIECECKVSTGSKTAGSDQFELVLELEKPGSRCYETLTDHPSTNWKIDTFLKCCGVQIAKGDRFEFRHDLAEKSDCRWVNPLGLRGWARFMVDEYPTGSGKKRNKVATFYTDKEKLPRRIVDEEAENEPF